MNLPDCYRILQARRLRCGDPRIVTLAKECEDPQARERIMEERKARLESYFNSIDITPIIR